MLLQPVVVGLDAVDFLGDGDEAALEGARVSDGFTRGIINGKSFFNKKGGGRGG